MYQLVWPWILLVLPLPWLVQRLLPHTAIATGGVVFAPFAGALREVEAGSGQLNLRSWMRWGALLCWLFLVFAAARPQWLGEAMELPESGRNLLLAVDVSGSMETADLDATGRATRLDVVKQVAGEFIRRREGDRLGLILFGSQAYLQTPLTFDRTTVATLLNESVIGIAGRETAIGDAIGMALKRLKGAEGEAVLVLLTDGANTAGHVLPRKAAALAAQQGLRIHTIGVGGKPRAVRSFFGMQMVSPAADLDEETLKAIADTTGGRFFRATDREALEEIYQQLDELEPVTRGSRSVRPVSELFPWPLGLALLLSFVLAIGAWRKGVAL